MLGIFFFNPFTPRPSYGEMIFHSNVLICWQNPIMLPFKWNLFGRTFAEDYLRNFEFLVEGLIISFIHLFIFICSNIDLRQIAPK